MKRWPSMASVSRAFGMLALAGTPLLACGARSWLPVDVSPDAQVDAPADVQTDAQTLDGRSCTTADVPLVPDVPNLYFVLDMSRSMLDGGKWANVRSVVANLVTRLGASANIGVTVFPAPGGNQCAAGIEVMPLQQGDSLGRIEAAFLTATALTPNGGTPTAATFRALIPKFKALPGISYVILATDGGPNCDATHPPCSVDQCTRNIDGATNVAGLPGCFVGGPNCCTSSVTGCLDGDATVLAVSDLHAVGVPTYVMGIPGSAPYGPVLDALAVAGGTARGSVPQYYQVDSPDTTALTTAFRQIAADAMKSCTIHLARTPADPNKVNVAIDGTLVPSDGADGWALSGQTVTLLGSTCGSIQTDAAAATLHVVEGCPTIR